MFRFHLFANFLRIKSQLGVGSRGKKRTNPPDEQILEKTFALALSTEAPHLKPPSGSAIDNWMHELFGIRRSCGHTILFPHKTDACAFCCSSAVDIDSLKASIKRHEQQTGDMTIPRQLIIKDLKEELSDLEASLSEHKIKAGRALKAYAQFIFHTLMTV